MQLVGEQEVGQLGRRVRGRGVVAAAFGMEASRRRRPCRSTRTARGGWCRAAARSRPTRRLLRSPARRLGRATSPSIGRCAGCSRSPTTTRSRRRSSPLPSAPAARRIGATASGPSATPARSSGVAGRARRVAVSRPGVPTVEDVPRVRGQKSPWRTGQAKGGRPVPTLSRGLPPAHAIAVFRVLSRHAPEQRHLKHPAGRCCVGCEAVRRRDSRDGNRMPVKAERGGSDQRER